MLSLVVVDGVVRSVTDPYQGMYYIRSDHLEVHFVSSRRFTHSVTLKPHSEIPGLGRVPFTLTETVLYVVIPSSILSYGNYELGRVFNQGFFATLMFDIVLVPLLLSVDSACQKRELSSGHGHS